MLDQIKRDVPVDLVLDIWGTESAPYWNSSGWRTVSCPLHEDKHASAGVSPDSEVLNCFQCGFEGDVFKLVMAVEKISFGEAVRWLQELQPSSGTTTSL